MCPRWVFSRPWLLLEMVKIPPMRSSARMPIVEESASHRPFSSSTTSLAFAYACWLVEDKGVSSRSYWKA
jgi:hypothetical protein